MYRLAILVVLVGSLAVAAPVPKDLRKKPANLNGVWEVVEYHVNGNKSNSTISTKWVIDGESLTIERVAKGGAVIGKAANVSYFLVKPEGGPANALDYTYVYTNNAIPSRAMPGVYELDADTLKFCWTNTPNGERPGECKPAQGNLMYVFKRVDSK
ncbi:MAG: TIGR03067 domain-containing protein [Fimbriiglobus sp.]|jgi:uncharacterized protein (TIGR03067 family)|nr:TIGR03067 domain-containing protein [Fimbriiglobus sp.]